ncbi:hypothetical protein [Streptomyces acidiscabies]|nr:hypothetical protein [Streptomyces acidiscabies]
MTLPRFGADGVLPADLVIAGYGADVDLDVIRSRRAARSTC